MILHRCECEKAVGWGAAGSSLRMFPPTPLPFTAATAAGVCFHHPHLGVVASELIWFLISILADLLAFFVN